MGLITRLFKNTGYLAVGNQIGNLLQFLFFLVFARRFGDTAVGQYSFAFSFTFILFFVLADLGLSAYLIREVARDQSGDRRLLARCLGLRILSLSVFSLVAIALTFVFFGHFPRETLIIILQLGLYHIFFSLADIFLAEFLGHDRMGLVAVLTIFTRLLITIVGLGLILSGFSFVTALLSFPLGSLVYLVACIAISSRSYGGVTPTFRDLQLKSLMMPILPFALTVIFMNMFYHQDILMLRFLKDDQSVGIYSVANKIVIAVLSVMVFVHTALLPTFSRLFVERKSELIEVARRTQRYLVLFGLPVTVGLFSIAQKVITVLYSEAYKNSVDVLRVLSWTIALEFAATTYSVLLTAINRQTQKVIVVGLCLALNFGLNVILIPQLGYKGAAVAKLISEAAHFVLMAYLVSKFLAAIQSPRVLVQSAVGCLFMFAFLQLFKQMGLVFTIPISAGIYFLSLGVMRGYSPEEIGFIKQRFKRIAIKRRGTGLA